MVFVDIMGLLSIHLKSRIGTLTQTHWENEGIPISVESNIQLHGSNSQESPLRPTDPEQDSV